jgi:capsule polysaccharide export protein KpsC/LpsZ
MKRLTKYSGNIDRLRKEYAPISSKPVWGIMLHVNWDCVSDYSPMAHASFDDWLLDTMREILNIPDVFWLIKVHPAEAWDNPASGVQRLIERRFPLLPPHVRVIPAGEEIRPLACLPLVDGGVTVYGTLGLELAVLGKPVILAGEAHYGDKGFTYDGLTPDAYRQLLREAGSLKPLSEEQRLLARRYAYCYFVQRQIPLPVVRDPNSAWWGFQHDKRHLLLAGRDPFVDLICKRILDGEDFIMDESLVALSEGLT